MLSAWRKFGVLLALSASAIASAQSRATASPARASSRRPNVLLVTIDTVRADHVGCYGAKGVETPTMDGVARDGIVFERAISQVPLTWPSHASMLTGTYPFHNGVQDFTGQPLSPRFRTIALSLHDHGYATAAVVSSFVLDRSWGLARGFDSYDDAFSGDDFLKKDLALVERRAAPSVDRALSWLAKTRSRPFFLWLHLYDPHSPYNPPEPFRTRYKDRPYDGEIAYADSQLGRIISWLKRQNLYGRTAIVLASDHGESLGEHGEREHGFFIYNSTVRVPLIIKPPGTARARGRRVSVPVEIASIAPTILDLAGLNDDIQKQFDVASLLTPRLGNGTTTAYSETFYPFSSFGWSPLRGLQSEDFHFVQAPRQEVYDLQADPAERRNIATDKAAMLSAMQQRLRDLSTRTVAESKGDGSTASVDPSVREKLQALGYVGSRAPVEGVDMNKLADPKDKIEVFEKVLSAADALRAGEYAKGRDMLAAVQKSDPRMYVVPFMLAEAAARQNDWETATSDFERTLALSPNFDQAMTGLARALFEQGHADEARSWLEKALKQNDRNYRAWYELGAMLAISAPGEAEQSLEKAIALQPNFAPAHRDLGMLDIRAQQYDKAAEQLQAAADLGLRDAKLLNFLGIAYSRTNRLPEAVRSYREALALQPNLGEAHLNLGFALQRQNQVAAAKSEYAAACQSEQKFCSMIPKL